MSTIVPKKFLDTSKYILLRRAPLTATPADIRRFILKINATEVMNVQLMYRYFVPTGDVLLTHLTPDPIQENIRLMHTHLLSAATIYAIRPSHLPRAELLKGSGPGGGLDPHALGSSVVVWGYSGRKQGEELNATLTGYKLAADEDPIMKLDLGEGQFSLVVRYLVRFATWSEAHRFVRNVHRTYAGEAKGAVTGKSGILKAYVVY